MMDLRKKKESCPDIESCTVDITREFFRKVCRTTAFANCHHFCKRNNELSQPVDWLVKETVEIHKTTDEPSRLDQMEAYL